MLGVGPVCLTWSPCPHPDAAAGGPVVAPSVPCTVLTPIAPLSLSFR